MSKQVAEFIADSFMLLGCALMAGVAGLKLWFGFSTGHMVFTRSRFTTDNVTIGAHRDEQPILFWFYTAFNSAFLMLGLVVMLATVRKVLT